MSYKERLTILHESEINDLYGVPSLSLEEKRVSFALNDPAVSIVIRFSWWRTKANASLVNDT